MLRYVRLLLVCAICATPLGSAALPPSSAGVVHQPSVYGTGRSASKHHRQSKVSDEAIISPDRIHDPVLWHDPGNIAAKDLLHGLGGAEDEPRPPFTFLREALKGSNPKFDARDANGVTWRVKLGTEARPEVVASRLLWAVGYYTDVDYNLREAVVRHLRMTRGSGRDRRGDLVLDARFARKPEGEKRMARWAWKHNPFRGTREFNGLRVMMAVMNNWDLKDVNNAVYKDKETGRQLFLVSDIGATFATNSLRLRTVNDKGNVEQYVHSKFITGTTPIEVSFGTPGAPTRVLVETAGIMLPTYIRRSRFDWIGDHIPRADARWVGELLGQLTHKQLVEAFRAGNFPARETDAYVAELERRIAELKAL